MAQGMVQGMAKGVADTRLSNARHFLAMGLSPEQVAEGTQLPLDEIMKLLKE